MPRLRVIVVQDWGDGFSNVQLNLNEGRRRKVEKHVSHVNL